MPDLPDVDQQSWNSFAADRWFKQSSDQINSLTSMPLQPGLGFLSSTSAQIGSLGQIQVPPPRPAPIPQPQPAPIPQPTLPPLPTPAPAPSVAPPIPTQPAPPPLPTPSPMGLPPSPPPTPPSAPEATTAPPQGLPMPTVPQVPLVPGGQPSTTGASSIYAPTTTPAPSPFAGEANGPFGQAAVAPGGNLQDYARQAAQKAGIDPDIFVRQIQQESGFNPTAKSGAGAIGIAQFMPGTAQGMGIDPTDPYAALEAAARLDAQHLKQYGGDWSRALAAYNAGPGNVDKYGGVPPFEETQRYVNTILGGAKQAPAPVSTAMSTSQFGDRQLSTDEAYAACGPAAAVRFAQAYGRNPTLREAVDMAREVGWTAQNGMAGISSEQKLLDKMGIPTKLVGPDVQAMASEAQTGNPVTISTPFHYFYADGYNPATQQFHVGRSGLDLKGGAEWMTAAQIQQLGQGPIQGALLANNPTIAAPSQSTTPQTALDAVRQQATNLFSNLRAPTFGTSRLSGSNSSDPDVQQLNRAVEIASLPKAPQIPQFSDTAATSPLDNLGNIVGNAVTSALSAVGLGGGPPGGPRQPQDQDQQDQSPQQLDATADYPDVGERARQMIERLQTLPGGMKLGQIVGAPDLLPPDTKNMSIAEAIREAITRGGENAMNLPRPSLGPGGLGMFDPRLGSDPRLDIPDILDPLSHLLGGVSRGGAERAAGVLEDAFGAERLTGMARGATEDLFGTPVGERAADVLGDVLSSNVGSNPVQNIARNGRASAAEGLSRNAPQRAWDNFVRTFINSNVDLDHIEEELARRMGRPLTDEERVGLLADFDPTHQAETLFDQRVG